MKLQSLSIENYLGAVSVQAILDTPITLFAGQNAAGKSSVKDAISLVLNAELGRAKHKKDAPSLLTDGAEYAAIDIRINGALHGVTISKSGKIVDSQAGINTDPAIEFALNAQRFASMAEADRRAFLFNLMKIKNSTDATKERLLAKGLNPCKVDGITHLLRNGFADACDACKTKATELKGSYRTLTGGDTWGGKKSADWKPAPLEVDLDLARKLYKNAIEQSNLLDKKIIDLQQMLGAEKQKLADEQKRIADEQAEIAKREKAKQDLTKANELKQQAESARNSVAETHAPEQKEKLIADSQQLSQKAEQLTQQAKADTNISLQRVVILIQDKFFLTRDEAELLIIEKGEELRDLREHNLAIKEYF